jgi:hypothetical protein
MPNETPALHVQDLRNILAAVKFAYDKETYQGESLGDVIELYSRVRKFINTVSPDFPPVEGLLND